MYRLLGKAEHSVDIRVDTRKKKKEKKIIRRRKRGRIRNIRVDIEIQYSRRIS